jgi:hypothetical protein
LAIVVVVILFGFVVTRGTVDRIAFIIVIAITAVVVVASRSGQRDSTSSASASTPTSASSSSSSSSYPPSSFATSRVFNSPWLRNSGSSTAPAHQTIISRSTYGSWTSKRVRIHPLPSFVRRHRILFNANILALLGVIVDVHSITR